MEDEHESAILGDRMECECKLCELKRSKRRVCEIKRKVIQAREFQ